MSFFRRYFSLHQLVRTTTNGKSFGLLITNKARENGGEGEEEEKRSRNQEEHTTVVGEKLFFTTVNYTAELEFRGNVDRITNVVVNVYQNSRIDL